MLRNLRNLAIRSSEVTIMIIVHEMQDKAWQGLHGFIGEQGLQDLWGLPGLRGLRCNKSRAVFTRLRAALFCPFW